MTIAKRVRGERRAEVDRVRALNAPVVRGPDGEDHGLDLGPAALARPAQLTRVDGKLRGAGQRTATPIYARQIECVDLFERLNVVAQITDRQCKAGKVMLSLRHAAGLEPRVTAKHSVVRDAQDEVLDDAEVAESLCPPEFDPRTYYRHLLRKLGNKKAAMIDAACDWNPECSPRHPGTANLATFKQALDDLANEIGLKREGIGV